MSISSVFTHHKGYNNVLEIWRCLRSEFTAKPSLKIARWNQTIAKLCSTRHQNLNLQKLLLIKTLACSMFPTSLRWWWCPKGSSSKRRDPCELNPLYPGKKQPADLSKQPKWMIKQNLITAHTISKTLGTFSHALCNIYKAFYFYRMPRVTKWYLYKVIDMTMSLNLYNPIRRLRPWEEYSSKIASYRRLLGS